MFRLLLPGGKVLFTSLESKMKAALKKELKKLQKKSQIKF